MNKIFILLLLIPTIVFASEKTLTNNSTNVFYNRTVGFKVTKPASWHFITAEQNYEMLQEVSLEDKEFEKLLKERSNAPLVAFTKYPIPHEDLNPSFKVGIKPIGVVDNFEPVKTLEFIMSNIKPIIGDFTTEKEPQKISISGIESAYGSFIYTMNTNNGEAFPVRSEMWLVPKGRYFFMIGSGARQDAKQETREEIMSIIDSIVIEQ
ncbi:MAG: hypothetical protein MRY49_02845 [Candidatus Pacebacteria bacterium]|nr:hypothetical protein [Candidatus Paceibacterota bacterium]